MDEKQLDAYNLVINSNDNVLISGSSGTGKTYLLNSIITDVAKNNIGVCAMTASAALLIKGRTLHSFLGIGLGNKTPEEMAKNAKFYIRKRLNQIGILIIDEVSMLNDELFGKLHQYLSKVRRNNKPFGNIQIILCGDFFQLPPIQGKYCFQHENFNSFIKHKIILQKSKRQKDDSIFENILEELRWGKCTESTLSVLEKCKGINFPLDIKPTKIFPLNRNVDVVNNRNIQKLIKSGNKPITFKTISSSPNLKNGIPSEVQLCVGCQVVLCYNIDIDLELINGSRGVVLNMETDCVSVKFVNGNVHSISFVRLEEEFSKDYQIYMPLKLAYALTVHKCQGMTLDCIEVDLGDSNFEYGQAYTSLSRAKDLQSVRISNLDSAAFKAHPEVIKFYTTSNIDSNLKST